VEQLDRDLAVLLHVVSEENGRHAAAAELALDDVPIWKGALEAGQKFGHGRVPLLGRYLDGAAVGG
jgi:hypothetical protein